MKNIFKQAFILVFIFLTVAGPAQAADRIAVTIDGLVCDFCARSLEKVFLKQEAVDSITVDLDTKLVTIALKDGQTLPDDTVRKLVTDAGYAVQKIEHDTTGAAQ